MSETVTPPGPSGNRWEPTADTLTTPVDPPSYGEPPALPPAPSRGDRLRDAVRRVPRSSLLAAAAAALLVVFTLGGFLVGRASAPDPVATPSREVGQPGQVGPGGEPGLSGFPGDRGGLRGNMRGDDGATLP